MESTDVSQTVAATRRILYPVNTGLYPFGSTLRKLKSMIRSHEDEIIHSLYNDLKKPPFESYASEIGIMYVEIEDAIRHVKLCPIQGECNAHHPYFLSSSRIYQEPYVLCSLWVHGIIHFICLLRRLWVR